MSVQVALLRGINVGGKNIVAMGALRDALAASGMPGARTYIQSGNIVAKSGLAPDAFGALISDVIKRHFDVNTWPAVLSVAALDAIIAAGEAGGDSAHAHAFVYREAPEVLPRVSDLTDALGPTETVVVSGHAVILYAPDGLARSKFAVRADRAISTPVTARNFRTMNKLRALAREVAG